MKVNYYGYSIYNTENQKYHLMDIRPFLAKFCGFDNKRYKNTFTYSGEKIFLIKVSANMYLFLMTKQREIIKKINTQDLSISEINELLGKGDSIGFASYLYIQEHYFGIASTLMAPRQKAFVHFMNDIFQSLNIYKYSFNIHPLLSQTSKEEIKKLPFIGRSVIQVNRENNLFSDLRDFFNGDTKEFEDVDTFELVIKPRHRKDISSAIQKVVDHLPDDGVEKFSVRAREELHGQLLDHYLNCEGMLSDEINSKNEGEIIAQIQQKSKSNKLLKEKVREHEQGKQFTRAEIKDISAFHNVNTWPRRLSDL